MIEDGVLDRINKEQKEVPQKQNGGQNKEKGNKHDVVSNDMADKSKAAQPGTLGTSSDKEVRNTNKKQVGGNNPKPQKGKGKRR
ncbi:hypothetical protein FRX31_031803 [Thalictrum thalictroides]|uniref:Uncharacterized protein n=1 Tax=Thalictrum thalictroides TaxID=46969 RepID=A0A7J6V0X2_THATH|nr:hypothetical protein FRX31_031803 [Thalictrum thalictroides]